MTDIIQTDSQPIDIDRSHYKNVVSNNKFCCFGFLLSGYPQHTLFFRLPIFFAHMIFPLVIHLCPLLYLYRVHNKGVPWFEIMIHCCTCYFLLTASFIDPGVIPRGDPEAQPDESKASELNNSSDLSKTGAFRIEKVSIYRYRWCQTCKIYRPPKSSHCKFCNFCVRGFDHHCYFLSNCVAIRNFKPFALYSISAFIEVNWLIGKLIFVCFDIDWAVV